MAKKIVGSLAVLLVALMVISFFSPNTKKANLPTERREISKKSSQGSSKKQAELAQKMRKELPKVKTSDWQLLLVNEANPVKEEPKNLTTMKNDYQIDQRIYDAYYAMEEAALTAGYSLTVISSYRSVAQQQEVYDRAVSEHMAAGIEQKAAEAKTAEYVTLPGTSEHHTGLALDVVDQEWYAQGNGLEEEFYDTPAGQWVDQHAATYGFIIRYPKDKEKITGINYEPWHIRYVGPESATYMVKHQLVLEEYLELLTEAGN